MAATIETGISTPQSTSSESFTYPTDFLPALER